MLKQAKLETFAKTGELETTTSAPECVFDTVNKVLSSAGSVQMQTADGKFFIQGEGFLAREASKGNYTVVISNKVETTIRKDLIATRSSQSKSANQAATNATAAPSGQIMNLNATSATNQSVRVSSDHWVLHSISNLAVYSSNVRVVDSQMDLTCEVMTLRRSTNDSLESIVAETNVVIISKQDNSRATGDKAVYIVSPERETVELTGNAHWQDSQHEVKADAFIFDRKDNTVRAEPNAYLKLPRVALDQSGPLSPKSHGMDRIANTNEFVEITSQALIMELATTNRPTRIMIAQTNVVILSPADKSRATGDQAVYKEAGSTFSLSGNAIWNSDQRLMRGDTLTFDHTNQIFTARSNAYLKLPLSAFGKLNLLPSGATNSTASTPGTNQFIEVYSDDCDYRDALLTFRGNVRGNFLEGEAMKGWMTCGQVTIEFTNNRARRIVARRRVAIGQLPSADETTRKTFSKLNCEILTVNISTNGQAESFVAEQDVVAEQNEVRPGTNDIHTKLNAEIVTGYVFAHTNQVERMVAERNVFIEQGDRSAQGDKAVFTATNNVVELTGRPTAKIPEGQITKAEALIWDRANEKLSARGSKLVLNPRRGGTNQTNLLFHK